MIIISKKRVSYTLWHHASSTLLFETDQAKILRQNSEGERDEYTYHSTSILKQMTVMSVLPTKE